MNIPDRGKPRYMPGICVLTAFAGAIACGAAPVLAASSPDTALPANARPLTADEIYKLYRDKSWQWDSGAGRMRDAGRQFSAWADGEMGISWADGRWAITETGQMCFNATWHSKQGAFPVKTCFSHLFNEGAIYQKREPDGQWFVFRHANIRKDDEASKLVSVDLVSQQRDVIRSALERAPTSGQ